MLLHKQDFSDITWAYLQRCAEQEVQAALKLTQAEIHQLAQNSFQASFLTAAEKQLFLDELKAFMAQFL